MKHGNTDNGVTRRGFLRAGVGTAAGLTVVGAASNPVSADMDAYNGYLTEEGTWEGLTTDATDVDEVFVMVGADGNNGPFAFNPPVVLVEPGTTITWEWTGEGGPHNVVHVTNADPEHDEQLFNSDDATDVPTPEEEGTTFEFTFEDEHQGYYPYVCEPHESLQMKGVVVVGEDHVETDLTEYDLEVDAGLHFSAAWGGAAAFGVVSLFGVAAYRELLQ